MVIRCLFLCFLVSHVYGAEPDVLQKLGVTRDASGNVVSMKGSSRPLSEMLNWKTIKNEVIDGKTYDPNSDSYPESELDILMRSQTSPGEIPSELGNTVADVQIGQENSLNNHQCHKQDTWEDPGEKGEIDGLGIFSSKEMTRREIFNQLGPPSQYTWCTKCPIWQYGASLVAFSLKDKVLFVQGELFGVRESSDNETPLRVLEKKSKTEILSILGPSKSSAFHHNHWQYGTRHLVFSSSTGLMTHAWENS